MSSRILAIAFNTYRESVRARILLGLSGVAFAVAIYSLIVGAFTLKAASRVAGDLGAASISLFSIAVAVVIGATSLHRELEHKTIFPILARPIGRGEYLVGKFLGTLLTVFVFILADTGLVLFLCAALSDRSLLLLAASAAAPVALTVAAAWKWPSARTFGFIPLAIALCALGVWLSASCPEERRVVLGAGALTMLEVSIITAFATLFSSFSTPFLSSLLTLGVFVVGRSADTLTRLPVKQFGQTIHDLGVGLSKVVPNLQVYVPPRPLLSGEFVDQPLLPYIGMASVASLGWCLGLLALAAMIFRKRDFL